MLTEDIPPMLSPQLYYRQSIITYICILQYDQAK